MSVTGGDVGDQHGFGDARSVLVPPEAADIDFPNKLARA